VIADVIPQSNRVATGLENRLEQSAADFGHAPFDTRGNCRGRSGGMFEIVFQIPTNPGLIIFRDDRGDPRGGGAARSKAFERNLDVKSIRLIRGVLGQAQRDHRVSPEIYN
jgi:hypothetical protein